MSIKTHISSKIKIPVKQQKVNIQQWSHKQVKQEMIDYAFSLKKIERKRRGSRRRRKRGKGGERRKGR